MKKKSSDDANEILESPLKAIIIGIDLAGHSKTYEFGHSRSYETRLAEACGLVEALHIPIVSSEFIVIRKPKAATLISAGHIETLRVAVESQNIGLVVFDTKLSPVQQRNLEKAIGCKVADRTGIILEIFGQRARTREGRLQVELARLTYEKSRLVRSWTHLERQRASGTTGGPGETQIELDRRMIAERILSLKSELESVRRTRNLHRKSRLKQDWPVIALVGYTNSGKSTLYHKLTGMSEGGENMLFATLDTNLKSMNLPHGRSALISDTVGFVSDLPHELVAAFRATLEEVVEADVILHVVDISNPDWQVQKQDVFSVLAGLVDDIEAIPVLEIWNKIDLLDADFKEELQYSRKLDMEGKSIMVSAHTGEGLDILRQGIADFIDQDSTQLDIHLRPDEAHLIGFLYKYTRVLKRESHDDGSQNLTARLSEQALGRFERLRNPQIN